MGGKIDSVHFISPISIGLAAGQPAKFYSRYPTDHRVQGANRFTIFFNEKSKKTTLHNTFQGLVNIKNKSGAATTIINEPARTGNYCGGVSEKPNE